jgi:hypothetical protein
MFTFNSYLKLKYWLRERIILWGLGGRGFGLFEGWRVRGFEGWRVVWEVSSSVRARFTKQYLLYMIYS